MLDGRKYLLELNFITRLLGLSGKRNCVFLFLCNMQSSSIVANCFSSIVLPPNVFKQKVSLLIVTSRIVEWKIAIASKLRQKYARNNIPMPNITIRSQAWKPSANEKASRTTAIARIGTGMTYATGKNLPFLPKYRFSQVFCSIMAISRSLDSARDAVHGVVSAVGGNYARSAA